MVKEAAIRVDRSLDFFTATASGFIKGSFEVMRGGSKKGKEKQKSFFVFLCPFCPFCFPLALLRKRLKL
jgi:hypothetical protein